jgi:hypothetical protein
MPTCTLFACVFCLQASQQVVAAAPGRSPFEMLDALSEWHAVLGADGVVSGGLGGGVGGWGVLSNSASSSRCVGNDALSEWHAVLGRDGSVFCGRSGGV